MNEFNLKAPSFARLKHFTPLRYPGGKGKLAEFIKAILKENRLLDGEYVEPYAGGAAIALELLFHEYVSRVHINDLSRPIHSFWLSVLNHTDAFCRLVCDTPLTVSSWDEQKKRFANAEKVGDLELGFSTFFLNRTNRSGILNGGIIGGRAQTGDWKIDARFNRSELIRRIEAVAKMSSRIHLTRMDANEFLRSKSNSWPDKTLVYIDPPYYNKGRDLYYDFYQKEDHLKVRDCILQFLASKKWVVSYDNVPAIHSLYKGFRKITYGIGYSARTAHEGSEAMFFSGDLEVPPVVGPLRLIEGGKKLGKIRHTAADNTIRYNRC